MKLFFDDAQSRHQPQNRIVGGRVLDPVETPDRLAALAGALQAAGLVHARPGDAGKGPLLQIHDAGYLDFLENGFERWRGRGGEGPELLPDGHPYRGAGPALASRGEPKPQGIIGRAGWYMGDMACGLGEGTWAAVYASAQAAIAAAEAVAEGERAAMALCRPPGHHAYADRAGGFCYLNNAAIAAEVLRGRFGRVAILDFDTHHGDGTQAIFYTRADVFFGSMHTDPSDFFPYYTGYADEAGAGPGAGATLNLPLPPGADEDTFLSAAQRLAAAAADHGAEALVLSAGWDAHREDPLSRLDVGDDAFARLGEVFGSMGLPTVVVQEGGYAVEVMTRVAPAFVRAFAGSHVAPAPV